MKKNLILMAVALMFANNAFAQEDSASVNEVKNPQIQTEEAKQPHQGKSHNLKEQMDHKEYHYNDGWVQHSTSSNSNQ